jgi:amino acid adenylation domain-containing protein
MNVRSENTLDLSPEKKRALLAELLRRKVSQAKRIPLSFAQRRLWFLARLEPDSPAYNIARAYQISGNLDVKLVRESLTMIAARHDVLRASFDEVDGEPFQFICDAVEIQVPLVDLAGRVEKESVARQLIASEALDPFDLRQAPLLRAHLLRLAPNEHILLLTIHHIVGDGWSMGILASEFGSIYDALSQNNRLDLPSLTIQYTDFARWQQETIGEAVERQMEYWREQLAEMPNVINLPTDRPRPSVQRYRGSNYSQKLSQSLSTALTELSRQERVTLFMTLLAAFQVLLMRYSGQQDIIVGVPIAGRNQIQTENLIGLFVNSLALRGDLSGNPSFRQLLIRTREITLDAYENQAVPFEKLVEDLNPERSLTYSPIFQVMFSLQNQPGTRLELSGLRVEQLPRETETSKFDLTLYLRETAQGLSAYYEYKTDLFDQRTIERLAVHFENLLKGIVVNPDCQVSDLPLMSKAERHQLLTEWSGRPSLYPRSASLQELFEQQVQIAPDAVALVFEGEQLSYDRLNRRANQLAHHLRKRGVGPEGVVGIAMERSIEMIVGLLGTLKAGGAYLPLDPGYPRERLALMLKDTGCSVVITQEHLRPLLPQGDAAVLALDDDWQTIACESEENIENRCDPSNLAYIVYTSGSTGTPKGVGITHRSVVRLVKHTNYASLDCHQVFLQFAPLLFDASTFEIWGSLLNGARLIVMPPGLPSLRDLGEMIASHGVTTLWLTAGLFHQMVDSQLETLGGVRQLLAGGDVLSIAHVERAAKQLAGCSLINGYGPTENTTFTCCYPVNPAERFFSSVPIGRPISNTEVYILDRKMQPVPVGVAGELYTGGDGLARCYLNDPAMTAERFVPNPFGEERLYRTGDQVRYRSDGNIEFLGRSDQQVKVRGYRIELEEIETVLKQHPAVSECVVVATASAGGKDKQLAAHVVVKAGQVTVEALRDFLQERLPPHCVPAFVIPLEALPLTPSGKVDRRALPDPLITKVDSGGTYKPPSNATEKRLGALWSRLLDRDPIGVHDNFFELGGHSLLAVQLVAEIEKEFGQRIPLVSLFQRATIQLMAASLDKEIEPFNWPTLVKIQPEGSRPPLFCVSAPNINALGYISLARRLGRDQPVYGLQAQYPEDIEGEHSQTAVEDLATDYLKATRSIQATGPYQFIGMCRGAHIAFEMARRLEAEGQRVAFLGILDTWTMENTYNRIWFLEYYFRRIKALLRLAPREQIDIVKRKARDLVTKRNVRTGQAEDLSPPQQRRNRLHEVYFPGPDFVPKKYPGRISVFRIRWQPIDRIRVSHLGWANRAERGIDVHIIPGRHVGLLREPNAAILAEQLSRHLLHDWSEAERKAKGEWIKLDRCSILHPALILPTLSLLKEAISAFSC